MLSRTGVDSRCGGRPGNADGGRLYGGAGSVGVRSGSSNGCSWNQQLSPRQQVYCSPPMHCTNGRAVSSYVADPQSTCSKSLLTLHVLHFSEERISCMTKYYQSDEPLWYYDCICGSYLCAAMFTYLIICHHNLYIEVSLHRSEVWRCLREQGVPEKYVRLVKDTYEDARTQVKTSIGLTGKITVRVGLHQGSSLSPYLFDMVLDVMGRGIKEQTPDVCC